MEKMAELHGMTVEEFQRASEEMHSSKPFVLIENYYPKEGEEEAVLAIAEESAKLLPDTDGLILAQCLKPQDKSAPIVNMTIWQSEKALNSFLESDPVKELFASETMAEVKAKTKKINVQKYEYCTGWHGMHH